jgi:hypothetical protein
LHDLMISPNYHITDGTSCGLLLKLDSQSIGVLHWLVGCYCRGTSCRLTGMIGLLTDVAGKFATSLTFTVVPHNRVCRPPCTWTCGRLWTPWRRPGTESECRPAGCPVDAGSTANDELLTATYYYTCLLWC